MVIYTKYLLTLPLLVVIVNAQIPWFGGCPDVPAIPNFDREQFLGTWYEIERYFTVSEFGAKCVSATYEKRPDGNIYINNAYTNRFTGVQRIISGVMKLTGKINEGLFNVRYSSLPIAYDTVLKVLGTDYETFAVISSCSSVAQIGHSESVWVMARKRVPSGLVLQKIYGVLDKYNIGRTFFIETDQKDCETLPPPVEAIDPTKAPVKKSTEPSKIEIVTSNSYEEDDDVPLERSAVPELFGSLKAYERAKSSTIDAEITNSKVEKLDVESEKLVPKLLVVDKESVVHEIDKTEPIVEVQVGSLEKSIAADETVLPVVDTADPVVVKDSNIAPETSAKTLSITEEGHLTAEPVVELKSADIEVPHPILVADTEIEPAVVIPVAIVKSVDIPEKIEIIEPSVENIDSTAVKTLIEDKTKISESVEVEPIVKSISLSEPSEIKPVSDTVAFVGATKSGVDRVKIQNENPIKVVDQEETPSIKSELGAENVQQVEPVSVVSVKASDLTEHIEKTETIHSTRTVTPESDVVTPESDPVVELSKTENFDVLESVAVVKSVPHTEELSTINSVAGSDAVAAVKFSPEVDVTVDVNTVPKPEEDVSVKSVIQREAVEIIEALSPAETVPQSVAVADAKSVLEPEPVISVESVADVQSVVEEKSAGQVASIVDSTSESQTKPAVTFKSVPESEGTVSIKSIKAKEYTTEHKRLTKKLISMRKVGEKAEGTHEIPVHIVSS